MEEGEYFAIETFGSTGRGRIVESVSPSHIMLDFSFIEPYWTGRVFTLCQDFQRATSTLEVRFHPLPLQFTCAHEFG
jgi:hypothetical protein